MSELFKPHIETLTRTPDRPLGSISDYVIDEMPYALAKIRYGFSNPNVLRRNAETLVTEHFAPRMDVIGDDPKKRDLALLDLLMLETGIAHSGAISGRGLSEAIDQLSERNGRIPSLTYEDVIILNPLNSDPRTFSQETTRQTEIDFYVTHREIENGLANAIINLFLAADTLRVKGKIPDIEHAANLLDDALDAFKLLHGNMTIVAGRMITDQFRVFRDYFMTHPYKKIDGTLAKGPSGAFSARVPIVDILLSGNKLPSEFTEYLQANQKYFPRDGQVELERAQQYADRASSLIELYEAHNRPPQIGKPLMQISEYMRRFRGAHEGGVKKHLPETYSNKQAGSAGETDVPKFLRGRRDDIPHLNS